MIVRWRQRERVPRVARWAGGSMLRYVSEVMQVMQKCHCDVRKIVSCQPRAFGWISSESMGNEV